MKNYEFLLLLAAILNAPYVGQGYAVKMGLLCIAASLIIFSVTGK